jgi:hypothetical protein
VGDFEAVLAWDLFNYFTPAQLRGVAAALARCCRPGALLFALISIHKQIPPRPLRYRIVGRDRLLYEGDAATTRPGPRYHQPELERALPGFRVDTSYLLRHGVQEYLFVRG